MTSDPIAFMSSQRLAIAKAGKLGNQDKITGHLKALDNAEQCRKSKKVEDLVTSSIQEIENDFVVRNKSKMDKKLKERKKQPKIVEWGFRTNFWKGC